MVAGILFLIFVILVAWKYPEQQMKKAKLDFEVLSPEDQILKHEAQFLADRKLIENYEIFRGSKGLKDAGPYLNPLVRWDNQGPSKLQLPKDLSEKLKDKDWVAFEPDFKTLKLDFTWMEKLSEFDHWAADLNNQYITISDRPLLQEIPFPGYMELTNWAKLRLIHGRKTQTMVKALEEVRQLTRLIFTNDYLVSSTVAVAILRHEGNFVQNYNPKIFGAWKTIPDEALVAAKRYFWGISEMVDPRLSNEVYERFSGADVGKCQMISEGMMKNLIVRDHLKMTYPGAIKRFNETVKNSLNLCRKSLVHMMWEDPEWTVFGRNLKYEKSLVKPENESDWKWKLLMIHPRVEEYFALTMLSISAPNYLRQYEEFASINRR